MVPTTTIMEPKEYQNEPRDLQEHPLRVSIGKLGNKWFHSPTKIDKSTIQRIIKQQSPESVELDAKGVPKWNQTRCQYASKTNVKTGNETDDETHDNYVFLNGRSRKV